MSASTPSPCVSLLKGAIKAGSTVGSCQYVAPTEPELKALCPNKIPPPALKEFDKQVLCAVFCCCLKAPNIGSAKESNLYQGCVAATLDSVDESLGWKSRYKGEISYSMNPSPGHPKAPYPLMHRVNGKDTTQPSENWLTRTKEIPGYKKGRGDVRRPDVVIVRDPTKPPMGDNIVQVVEMKFPNDPDDELQLNAYGTIAGGRNKVAKYDAKECGCEKKDKQPETEPVLEKILAGIIALLLGLFLLRFIPNFEEIPIPVRPLGPLTA